jgi:hypothetical protein
MSIEIIDKNIADKFSAGDIVYRITANHSVSDLPVTSREVNIVTSLEDFNKKLSTHLYTPLLFICNLPTRLAYLHGCLNYRFDQQRSEVYIFWWREIYTDGWKVWFKVNPYVDSEIATHT